MVRTVLPPLADERTQTAQLFLFTVFYGQHPIGIARAHDEEQAMHLIEAHFLGDIEPTKMKARSATPEEEAIFYERLGRSDRFSAIGVLL